MELLRSWFGRASSATAAAVDSGGLGSFNDKVGALTDAFKDADFRAFKALVADDGFFSVGWNFGADRAALDKIAKLFARLVIELLPGAGGLNHSFPPLTASQHADAAEIVELALAKGVDGYYLADGYHAVLVELYPPKLVSKIKESDVLAMLRRLKAGGMDITMIRPKQKLTLAHMAAKAGYNAVIDFAITECGIDVDVADSAHNFTPLTIASYYGHIPTATHLLRKHRARAAYPDFDKSSQPLSYVVRADGKYNDAQMARIVEEMLARDPLLMEVDAWKPMPLETPMEQGWNPVSLCADTNMTATLELFLRHAATSPRIREMAARPVLTGAVVTPALLLLVTSRWQGLELMLRCIPDLDVISGTPYMLRGAAATMPSLHEQVSRSIRNGLAVPRRLVAAIRALAVKQEKETAARAGAGSRAVAIASTAAKGISCNVFEDPSLKVLTEKEAKAKAKRRAKKQKAKANKLAAATANAGAGAVGAESSSDDSDDDEEPFEEPDDNLVDSRYAPSLDIMLAERERERQASGNAGATKPEV